MNLKIKWHIGTAYFSLFTIGIYFLLQALHYHYYQYPLFLLLLVGGLPLLLQILFKLFTGNWGADILAALALITGIILHEYLAAAVIILMLASGQALEQYAMRKASSVLLALEQRLPKIAHRKNNHIEDIALEHININDEIIVYPHEACPVDGIVVEGYGSMDESYLTGEPYQISKAPGAFVLSGAQNGESPLIIKTTQLTSNSRYASIIKILESAEQKRPSIRRLGDKIGMIFGPLALLFAILSWYLSNDSIRFLAVLVIATPCPLLIAIPITIISAISKAAKQSIIIKDPTVVEQLPVCKTAIFDKTGTLTYGRPTLTDIAITADYSKKKFYNILPVLNGIQSIRYLLLF